MAAKPPSGGALPNPLQLRMFAVAAVAQIVIMGFGHLVLRFHHGEMSQAELGQHIGVTRQTIAAIEATFRIAHVFDVPLGEVFQWDPDAE